MSDKQKINGFTFAVEANTKRNRPTVWYAWLINDDTVCGIGKTDHEAIEYLKLSVITLSPAQRRKLTAREQQAD